MSSFTFSHCIFHSFGEISAIFIKFKTVLCQHFKFGTVLKLSFGKGLTKAANILNFILFWITVNPYPTILNHGINFAESVEQDQPAYTCIGSCLQSIKMTSLNSLPNDKILDLSRLKALADDTINVSKKLKLVLGRVENILGKGENAVYQQFFPFPKMSSKAFFLGVVQSRDLW